MKRCEVTYILRYYHCFEVNHSKTYVFIEWIHVKMEEAGFKLLGYTPWDTITPTHNCITHSFKLISTTHTYTMSFVVAPHLRSLRITQLNWIACCSHVQWPLLYVTLKCTRCSSDWQMLCTVLCSLSSMYSYSAWWHHGVCHACMSHAPPTPTRHCIILAYLQISVQMCTSVPVYVYSFTLPCMPTYSI